jgi:Family of unknown function (DUF6286)
MMRLTNRLLSVVLASLVAAAGAVVAVEIALAALSDPHWVLPWPRWHRWALDHTWAADPVVVTCWVLVAVGLVILFVGVVRYRPVAVPAEPLGAGVTASVRRSSLERSLQRASQQIDGISAATVKVSRRRVRVSARSNRRDTGGLKQAVTDSVAARLGALRLAKQPDLRVRVVSRSR